MPTPDRAPPLVSQVKQPRELPATHPDTGSPGTCRRTYHAGAVKSATPGLPARGYQEVDVRLVSTDGARLDLRVAGYEYPDPSVLPDTVGDFDYDANWLVVQGRVTTTEGRSWTFRDPCLLVPEAHELGNWLQTAAAGRFRRYRKRDGAALEFLEPNLTFALRRRTVERVVLRVGFSHESAPGPRRPQSPGAFEMLLRIRPAALWQAADAWAQEITAFPRRAGGIGW